jgi:hypothetical protein
LKEGQIPISRLANAGITSSAPTDEFKFSETVDDQYDFCDHPWAHYNQGHFFSDWRTIHALYPMFSPAKGVGYSDILIPSHYYFSSTKRYTYGWDPVNMIIKDVDDMETKWEDKSDDIFWRGATTGGGSSPPGFLAQYQRHRSVHYLLFEDSLLTKLQVHQNDVGSLGRQQDRRLCGPTRNQQLHFGFGSRRRPQRRHHGCRLYKSSRMHAVPWWM